MTDSAKTYQAASATAFAAAIRSASTPATPTAAGSSATTRPTR